MAKNTAVRIIAQRDVEFKEKKDFYNFSLGFAYRDASMGLSTKDFIRYVNKDLTIGYEPGLHVMGVDQGCYIVIARQKPGTSTQRRPNGIWQIVWIEHCTDLIAFSKIERKKPDEDDFTITRGKISKLIEEYNVVCVVVDRLPNAASADALALEHDRIIWRNTSSGTSKRRLSFEGDEDKEEQIKTVVEKHHIIGNRHMQIDWYFEEIKSGIYEYPGDAGELFKDFMDHHCSLLKDDSVKITKGGISKGDINYHYYTVGGKPDHYGQAGKYLSQAIELRDVINPQGKMVGILSIRGVRMAS